jgi:hypothetical protein
MRAAFVAGLALLTAAPASRAPERVRPNDNRVPAGAMRGDTLALRLETRLAEWHPDGDAAPGTTIPAFAEAGRPAQVPGPLVRVRAGTAVAVTLRNALADTLHVHGLHARGAAAAAAPAPLVLAPGESRAVAFRLDAPGTYYYWGTTTGRPIEFRIREDAQLTGAIVVDPPDAPPGPARDRVFVLGMWTDTVARAMVPRRRVLAVVNGRTWPNTERLSYAVGDSVRWRVINATADLHPMHLHGFYFRVDARGDGAADTTFRDGVARMAVTEPLAIGGTYAATWVPERPGNWLYHCHIPEHFAPRAPLGLPLADAHAAHAAGAHMGGFVLGIAVRDGARARAVAVSRAAAPRRRRRASCACSCGRTPGAPPTSRCSASRRTSAGAPNRRPTPGAAPGRRSCSREGSRCASPWSTACASRPPCTGTASSWRAGSTACRG